MRRLIGLVLLLLLLQPVLADGAYFPDRFMHLYEPDQKAVVVWDGQNETLLIASSVRSQIIGNFAWVVPIRSSTPPVVTAGNISVFKTLTTYLERPRPSSYGRILPMAGGGVEVIETKKVDIYDITILRATDASDLVEWLRSNGYQLPAGAERVFQKHVTGGDAYFIANRINLRNKYEPALDFLESFRTGAINKTISGGSLVRSLSNYRKEDAAERLAQYVMMDLPYDDPLGRNWSDLLFIPEENYEALRQAYGVNSEVFEKLYAIDSSVLLGSEFNSVSCRYEVRDEFGELMTETVFEGGERVMTVSCERLIENFGSLDTVRELFASHFVRMKQEYRAVYDALYNEIDAGLGKIDPGVLSAVNELRSEYEDLGRGVSTPLKFEFQPDQPYYPLEISGLNPGHSQIEVYVIGQTPFSDGNEMLTIDVMRKIAPGELSELEKELDFSGAEYVTRLVYTGALENLTVDALFVETEYMVEKTVEGETPSILERIWDWIAGLLNL